MIKDKKHIAWFVLSIAGFVLFVAVFVLFSLNYYGVIWQSHWDEILNQIVITEYSARSYYQAEPYTIYIFAFYLVWAIASFVLHIVGAIKGDKYKYLNHHISRMTTLAFSFFAFYLILTESIKILESIAYSPIKSYELYSGFWAVLATIIVLVAVQVAAAFMLKLKDKKIVKQ
ncbi:MAG: hypothetical protein LBN07_02035 [Christensenellaceae bacterium]|jgi:hypothetical protein|nr:hypothetical protein [Christensenellaceae bacterium]